MWTRDGGWIGKLHEREEVERKVVYESKNAWNEEHLSSRFQLREMERETEALPRDTFRSLHVLPKVSRSSLTQQASEHR